MKPTKYSPSAEVSNEDTIKITNQSGSPVYVLYSFTESDIKSPYESTLTLLSTVDGKRVIADKETAVIPLKETYCNPEGKTEPFHQYALIFVNPNTLSPISKAFVVREKDHSYLPISITEKDKDKLIQARRFHQRLLAYPAADFSVNFAKALERASKPQDDDDSLGGFDLVDKYFQDSKLFKSVDYDAFALETSYENNYAGVWVGNKPVFTFYFYVPSSKSERIEASDIKAPDFVGSLHFTQEKLSSKLIDPKKGYTILFKDDKDYTIPIKFEGGYFSADNDSDVISLQPTFMTKSTLTSKSQDKEIIPTINGKVNGVSVIGITVKQDLEANPGTDKSWYAFWHPKNFQQWLSLFMSIIGIGFGVHIMIQLTSWIYKKAKGFSSSIKKPTSAEIESEGRLLKQGKQEIFNKLGGKGDILSETFDTYVPEMREAIATQYRYQEILLRLSTLDEQALMLKKIAGHIGANREIVETFGKIEKSIDLLKQSLENPNTLKGSNIEEFSTSIQKTITKIKTKNLLRISRETRASLEASAKNLEEIREIARQAEEHQREVEEGSGGESEDMKDFLGEGREFELPIEFGPDKKDPPSLVTS